MASDEGPRREAHPEATHGCRPYSADLSDDRSKPAPDGADPSSGPSGHLPPQGGKGARSHVQPDVLDVDFVSRMHAVVLDLRSRVIEERQPVGLNDHSGILQD